MRDISDETQSGKSWDGPVILRPHLLLRLCALAILIATLVGIILMLRVPFVLIDAELGAGNSVEIGGGPRPLVVPDTATVTFRSAQTGETVRIEAALLPGVAEPRGTAAENAQYWHARDRLAAMLAQGPVEVVAGGQHLTAQGRERHLADLTLGFWMSMLAGAAAALLGLWVWILRPREWAPFMFAASGLGLFVGCFTTALNISPGLGLTGTFDQTMLIANYASGVVCAGALAGLFARFPQPLVKPIWLVLAALINLAAAAVVAFDALPGAVDIAILTVLADSLAIIGLLFVQWWRARQRPDIRSGLLPIAICTGVSTFLFCALSMIGQLAGGKPLVQPDMTAPLLLLIYLGLAVAITRARLFALGQSALSLLMSACAIVLFLLLDALVLSNLTERRDLALLIAVLLAIAVYLPAREWLLRRAERLHGRQTSDLLLLASDIALPASHVSAQASWAHAITVMFDPLERVEAPNKGSEPTIEDNGRALHLPSPLDGTTSILRYGGGGTRTFRSDDLKIAARFLALIARLIDARDAYLRGADEERGRIARDLHDDVSARLLTSLHRTDTRAMHADVREAIADIRTIVTGLSGTSPSLGRALGHLRHESQERLEAAGIRLRWPLVDLRGDEDPLPYEIYRNLLSIVRECVSNIIRHAGADHVDVDICIEEGFIGLAIVDDGSGFAGDSSMGRGIENARRRARRLGGSFEFSTGIGGTSAYIRLPCDFERMNNRQLSG
ncbi:sensor histidine kinase [Novosphingobium sp. JCM 18896]|uniref:sensor histidine kinase n=1 Tax=Novosphingobium sp. JCM 18896 TaxID=2989731 RepID=UPI002221C381|nr:histidine kinase [Novosphingobium sp. JCM 18896]MCW1432260.1 histidine kinase [Novosphingobium sp. JCM 18896]